MTAPVRRALASAAARTSRVRSDVAAAYALVRPWFRAVTVTGWTVLGIGVVAWVAAGTLGWVEAAVAAFACLLLLAVAALFMIGRTRLTVTTLVEPPRVTVGEPLTGELTARNDSRAPLVSTSLEFPIGEGGVTYDLPVLMPGGEHSEMFLVPTSRRGVITVGPVRTVRGDPLGLFRREQEWTERTEVFVHPRTVRLEAFGAGLVRDLEGITSQNNSVSDLAFHALREYVSGDDLRHVHWRSSARHGKLLVRQFLDTRRSHLAVVADGSPASYATEDEYETAISVTASMLRRALLDEYTATLVTGEVMLARAAAGSGGGRAALDACARATPSSVDLLTATGAAARQAPDASLVVVVTGRHTSLITLQRAMAHFSVDAATVAVRVDASAEPGMRTAGDLVLLTVASLDQLPAVLLRGLAR